MRKRTVYRDRSTGRFASKASWTRSKASGGTRFVRTSVRYHPPEPKGVREQEREEEKRAEELDEFLELLEETEELEPPDDWTGAFDTPGGKRK